MTPISKGRLGLLANEAGFYLDRLQNSAIKTGQLLGDRLVAAGLAAETPTSGELLIPSGAPRNVTEMRELFAALKSVERIKEGDPWPTAAGRELDLIAQANFGLHRATGEADAEFRKRVTAYYRHEPVP